MKKLIIVCSVIVFILGNTHCKKNVETVNDVASHGVYIELNVDGDSKVVVTPGFEDPTTHEIYAKVTFEGKDIIYVGNNGAYCGWLQYDKSTKKFSGTINPTSEEDYLHFYFLGNKGAKEEPTSVNIENQTEKYPVISYGHSTVCYQSGQTEYSATLFNKCAIMKFNTTDTDKVISITGMNNTVTVNFAANNGSTVGDPYSFSKVGNGIIRLHAETNTERWAILLPQSSVTTATAHASGYLPTSAFAIEKVEANKYYSYGVNITLEEGVVEKAFTINEIGDQVFFAPGNLQYIGSASTPYWKFADNQFELLGHSSGQGSSNTNVDRDLFGWGTSGFNGKYPYMTSTTSTDYGGGNMNITFTEYDWGVYNTISNAGNQDPAGLWRLLTADEMSYIFNTRTTSSGHRYAMAQVNTVNGIVLLPDTWSDSYSTSLTNYNIPGAEYTDCVISSSEWLTMESHGAVFLPAAGWREGTTITRIGNSGLYWTSTNNGTKTAKSLMFAANTYPFDTDPPIVLNPSGPRNRHYGLSVRLIRDI